MDILRLTTVASVRTILPSVAAPHAQRLQVSWPATLVKRGNIIRRTATFPKHDIGLDHYMRVLWPSG
jgi:hypothetical protein